MHNYQFTIKIILLFLIVACSDKKEQPEPDILQDSLASQVLEQMLPADAPEWYLNATGQDNMVGRGMGRSRRVQIARDKALMQAQAELAKKFFPVDKDSVQSLPPTRIAHQKQQREGKLWRVYLVLEAELDSSLIKKE